MIDDAYGRVPAGWYPDPLGLPQLRWWDNLAWTEHVAEARGPMVAEAEAGSRVSLGWADDELPTRRERRERERAAERGGSDTATITVTALRELAAPRPGTSDPTGYATAAIADAPGAGADDAPSSTAPTVPDPTHDAFPAPAPAAVTAPAHPATTHTAAVWVLALLPVAQLVASLLLVAAGVLDTALGAMAAVWLAPYPIAVLLAALDRGRLRRSGMERPASWALALLGAPAYLLGRAAATVRERGSGFAPLVVWVALAALQAGAVLAVPGLVIAALPTVFSSEAEAVVAADARVIGTDLDVDCPAAVPVLAGQQFECAAQSADGDVYPVTVSLQRANGWIDWQIDDWGVYQLQR